MKKEDRLRPTLISTPCRIVFFQRLREIPRIFVAPSAASEPTETSLQNTWRVRGSETYPLLIEGQTLAVKVRRLYRLERCLSCE